MDAGIVLARYYAREAERRFGIVSATEPLQAAQRALDWLQKHAVREISLTQLYQQGPRQIRTARAASDVAGILEEHGWLERTGILKRTPVWRLVADDFVTA